MRIESGFALLAGALVLYTLSRCLEPRKLQLSAVHPPPSDVEEAHPLWTPPVLCPDLDEASAAGFPAARFCPMVKVQYSRRHFAGASPPLPDDYWMLDAPAIMAVLATKVKMSRWLVNFGANPSATGEDGERRPVKGDDCTALWPMGFSGLNFDIPENSRSMRDFYIWPKAQIDTEGTMPNQVVAKLDANQVPKDLDFLKIDVDSFDCEILDAMVSAGWLPKALSIESSPWWPPPLVYRTKPSPKHPYEEARFAALVGCSLQAVTEVLLPHGYTLIQFAMEDAWFVKSEFATLFGHVQDPRELFRKGNPNLYASHQFRPARIAKCGHAGELACPDYPATGREVVEEMLALQAQPAEMLKLAKRRIEGLYAWNPRLRDIEYEIGLP